MHPSAYLILLVGIVAVHARDVSECACGYEDASTGELYTDAIIVYFNETQTLPNDVLVAEEFTHKSEKGYNSIYRQGATLDNVMISNISQVDWMETVNNQNTLELFVSPSTNMHVVDGGSVRTRRQDILHGTFRASMRGPHPWVGGSALSMILLHNETSSFEIDLCNTNDPEYAAVTQLINSEYPSQSWPQRVNYTMLKQGSDEVAPASPWDFMDLQLDWSKKHVNFSIAGNHSRSVHTKNEIPTEPLPLIFKHWSIGDSKWMQGPPVDRSAANIAWVRAFFNSSLTSSHEQRDFDSRCKASRKCDVNDLTLRGSSSYQEDALLPWKESPRNKAWKLPSAIVSGSGAFVGFMMLLNVLLRRAPWKRLYHSSSAEPTSDNAPLSEARANLAATLSPSTVSLSSAYTTDTPGGLRSPASMINGAHGNLYTLDPKLIQSKMFESHISGTKPIETGISFTPQDYEASDAWSSIAHTLVSTPDSSTAKSTRVYERELSKTTLTSPTQTIRESRVFDPNSDDIQVLPQWPLTPNPFEDEKLELKNIFEDRAYEITPDSSSTAMGLGISTEEKGKSVAVSEHEIIPEAPQDKPIVTSAHNPPPKKRIDYLAGLVTISCFSVTFIHFTLTFIPFAGGLSFGMHYKSEYWARYTVSPLM